MANSPAAGLQVHAKFFRGLADMSRLTILEALRGGRKNVSEVVSNRVESCSGYEQSREPQRRSK